MRSTVVTFLFICIAAGGKLTAATPTPKSHPRHSADFIHISCRSTRYPALCEKSLAVYAPAVRHSPRQLAHAALSVSVARVRDASSFVYRLSARSKSPRAQGGGAVRDCLETLADSVDRLRQSAKEMERMGRYGSARFNWHLSNVQTWVSAALTDESTCLDSLSEDAKSASVRGPIRERIVSVAQITSNALALVNRLQGRN